MKNDSLDQIWNLQKKEPTMLKPQEILAKAGKQRKGQFLTISILVTTILVLIGYATYIRNTSWNDFTWGLFLMISSLVFRVGLEFLSLYRKESKLISLDNNTYKTYLKKHYRLRLGINYIITPVCFVVYVMGFTRLLPYFEREFSSGFYSYILFSGIISLLVIGGIVIYSVFTEHRFLRHLNKK